jgi:uncharacterized paraquat-inducible protein A
MPFGVCPNCKMEVRHTWFKAYCDRCKVELTESKKSRMMMAVVPIIGFIVILVVAQEGTERILAERPEDTEGTLFLFYMTLIGALWIVTAVINQVLRRKFSIYEPPKNT